MPRLLPTLTPERLRKLRPFFAWLACFYAAWLAIVLIGGHVMAALAHWPIAVAMALGSYIAGSTPMGGGTIGFPILVLLFDQPASLGRDFSFAIQSVGMVSASIFIFAVRQPLETTVLRWAMLGATLGTPLGVAFVAPMATGLFAKILFAVIWASFGIMHMVRLREITSNHGITPTTRRFDRALGLIVGVGAGATVASITGVGIDMAVYVALVLIARADVKIAVPTSVVLMAYTSVVGIVTRVLLARLDPGGFAMSPALLGNWLAAAPVVAIGAPVGAFVVRRIPREPTLLIVSVLCVVQFVWTLWHERGHLTAAWIAGSIGAVIAMNGVFHLLYVWGRRLAARRSTVEAA